MNDIQIGNIEYVWLIAGVVLGVIVLGFMATAYASFARRRAIRQFAPRESRMNIAIASGQPGRRVGRWTSAILLAISLLLLAVSLLDIRWGKTTQQVPQKGIEVIFVLDVSRSMLAEDVAPNRLVRAKQQIKDTIDEMAGDRVGLVVFAGEARQVVPLTSHYDDLKQTLDSVGPHSVMIGGSKLGEAITTAASGFLEKTNDHKAIVIFTDGEDQESKPLQIAEKLHSENGVRIFTVGLGDMDQGARIPDKEASQGYLRYAGEQVYSKMNGEILSQIATTTDGAYIPAGTKRVDMSQVYHRYIADVEQTNFEMAVIDTYMPRFQWLALPALLLIIVEVGLSTRRGRAARRGSADIGETAGGTTNAPRTTAKPARRDAAAATGPVAEVRRTRVLERNTAVLGWVLCLLNTAAFAPLALGDDGDASSINEANELVRRGELEAALKQYEQLGDSRAEGSSNSTRSRGGAAAQRKSELDYLRYNSGVAHYRQGDLATAEELFAKGAMAEDSSLAAMSRYNLGNCHYASALQAASQDKPQAIQRLRDAIASYRSSLRLDPRNADARANIELANALLKQLEEQDQKQEEQQPQPTDQPQPDQQPQNQSSDQQSQEQKSQQQQSQEEQGQEEQREQEENEKEKQEQERNEQENSEQQQSEQQPDSSPQSGQNDGATEQDSSSPGNDDSQPEQPQDRSESKGSNPTEQLPDDAASGEPNDRSDAGTEENEKAPGEPDEEQSDAQNEDQSNEQNATTGELSSPNAQPDETTGASQGTIEQGTPTENLMTKEEAMKLLQAVRDRDMLRRLRKEQLDRSRRVPVERDW